MLNGPIWNRILQFAFPLMATGILQQLFNAADIAVIGRFTGEFSSAAMAAVGANTPIIGLLLNSFIGISLGSNVLIANAVGKKDKDSVSKTVHTSILLALAGGLLITLIGEVFAVPILSAQNVPEEVLPMAILYFRIYMAGMPVILLYNFEAAIFRGSGNTKTPLAALAVSGVLNVGLNLFFVAVLHMTVDGVAIATVTSNCVSSIFLFVYLLRSDSPVHVRIRKLKVDWMVLSRILRIGVPAGLQSAVFSFANIIIQSAVNSLGTVVMAASSAAFNIEIFAYYVLNSFSQACTTFVGQNNGAGNIRRCRKIMGLCFLEGVIATAFTVLLILLFGHELLSIFNTDPEVIRTGYYRLLIIFTAYVFSLSYEVMAGYLRGFGISLTPAILTMVGVCGVRITWVYAIFPHFGTYLNLLIVYPVSLCTTAVLILIALLFIKPASKALSQKEKTVSVDRNSE